MAGLFAVAVLSFIMLKSATFDYSKVSSEHGLDDQILIRRSVDASLSDFTTKMFLIRYDNPNMGAIVSYVSPYEVSQMKANSEAVASLPDSKKLIEVQFDSQFDNSIPNPAKLFVYLEPETYRVYGAYTVN